MFLRVCDVTMSQFIFLRGFVLKPTCRAEILWAAVGLARFGRDTKVAGWRDTIEDGNTNIGTHKKNTIRFLYVHVALLL